MVKGFWKNITKPVFILAPMAGVTDTVFRQIVAKYGKPDIFFTEFVSCNGLCSAGREKLMKDLWFTEQERPIVGQIFGSIPEKFYETAQLLAELGFDGIDINTGCPDKCVEKQGAGAALINDPELTKQIIKDTKRGAPLLPVSVKTRLGYHKNCIREWLKHLLEVEPVAVTIHSRTRQEMSKVPANWEAIAEAVEIRNSMGVDSLIIGNGDVKSVGEAKVKIDQSGADGIMIGRGIYGNPWLFNSMSKPSDIDLSTRINVLIEHVDLFEATYGNQKNFAIMRKFFNSYISGFPSSKSLKVNLMAARNAKEVKDAIQDYLNQIPRNPILT